MADDKRYRFVLMEQPDDGDGRGRLPVRYRRYRAYSPPPPSMPRPNDPMGALIEAFALLDRRGTGFEAWAPALGDNPLAFLLDALEDAVLLREAQGGRVIYRNRAARRLPQPQGELPAAEPLVPDDGETPAQEPPSESPELPADARSMRFRWGRLGLELIVLKGSG